MEDSTSQTPMIWRQAGGPWLSVKLLVLAESAMGAWIHLTSLGQNGAPWLRNTHSCPFGPVQIVVSSPCVCFVMNKAPGPLVGLHNWGSRHVSPLKYVRPVDRRTLFDKSWVLGDLSSGRWVIYVGWYCTFNQLKELALPIDSAFQL
jgi:hypothetical protein